MSTIAVVKYGETNRMSLREGIFSLVGDGKFDPPMEDVFQQRAPGNANIIHSLFDPRVQQFIQSRSGDHAAAVKALGPQWTSNGKFPELIIKDAPPFPKPPPDVQWESLSQAVEVSSDDPLERARRGQEENAVQLGTAVSMADHRHFQTLRARFDPQSGAILPETISETFSEI